MRFLVSELSFLIIHLRHLGKTVGLALDCNFNRRNGMLFRFCGVVINGCIDETLHCFVIVVSTSSLVKLYCI